MSDYVPELGQAIFGQTYHPFAVPTLADAALSHIRDRLTSVRWNVHQQDLPDPFGNTAASFSCDAFQVQAYSWGDENQPFNFKWRNVEIKWYKYLGRGMSANVELTPDLVNEMLVDCIAALTAYEKAHCPDIYANVDDPEDPDDEDDPDDEAGVYDNEDMVR